MYATHSVEQVYPSILQKTIMLGHAGSRNGLYWMSTMSNATLDARPYSIL